MKYLAMLFFVVLTVHQALAADLPSPETVKIDARFMLRLDKGAAEQMKIPETVAIQCMFDATASADPAAPAFAVVTGKYELTVQNVKNHEPIFAVINHIQTRFKGTQRQALGNLLLLAARMLAAFQPEWAHGKRPTQIEIQSIQISTIDAGGQPKKIEIPSLKIHFGDLELRIGKPAPDTTKPAPSPK